MRVKSQFIPLVQEAPMVQVLVASASVRPFDATLRGNDIQPAKAARKRHLYSMPSAVGLAALIAVAGCATFDDEIARGLKVEPIFNIKNATQTADAYFSLGQYYEGAQAWDKAIDANRKAIAINAKHLSAHNALGVALAQSGRLPEAEAALRQAVSLAAPGSHAFVRNNLGYVLLLNGKPQDAADVLAEVLAQDAGNTIAHANLQTALARRGDAPTRAAQSVPALAAAPATASAVVVAANVKPGPVSAAAAPAAMQVGFAPTIAALPQVDARSIGFAPSSTSAAANGLDAAATATPVVPSAPATPSTPPTPSPPNGAAAAAAAKALSLQRAQALALEAVPLLMPVHASAPVSPLEISNGNGVPGMAARVGRWMASQGLPAPRLSNQLPFAQQHTVVQYRSGQAALAQRVARSLPAAATAQASPTAGLRSDVRVVLGRDWVTAEVCLSPSNCTAAVRVASHPTHGPGKRQVDPNHSALPSMGATALPGPLLAAATAP
jgi:tetratricopeptide (TPR) repeat protein